jgi:hypothetical protein
MLLSLLTVGLALGLVSPAGAGPAQAAEVSAIKVHYVVSGGIAGRVWVDLKLESRHLSAEELRQLKKLIDDARFFDLPAELPIRGADIPTFTLTIERDGKKYTVHGKIAPEKLQPLLDWLEKKEGQLRAKAEKLVGRTVRVTGTLQDNSVVVSDISISIER